MVNKVIYLMKFESCGSNGAIIIAQKTKWSSD